MPASTILLLESDAAAGEAIAADPDAVPATRSPRPPTRTRPSPRPPTTSWSSSTSSSGPRSAVDICREIRGDARHGRRSRSCASDQTEDVEERIRFLEAGADDVMARPFDARELEARVEALLLRFQRSQRARPGRLGRRAHRSAAPVGRSRSTAPRAASGRRRSRRTSPSPPSRAGRTGSSWSTSRCSSAASRRHLNLDPKQTIADVVRDEAALREPELLRTYAMRHDSGLHVLAAPAAPEAAEIDHAGARRADPGDAARGLRHGRHRRRLDARRAVADDLRGGRDRRPAGHPGDRRRSRRCTRLLEYLDEAGSIGLKSTFVLNNLFAREILKLRDVESFLGTKMAVELPYDPFLYLKAVNEGVPIVTGAPRSLAAERLVKLSSIAFGKGGYQVPGHGRGQEVRWALPPTPLTSCRPTTWSARVAAHLLPDAACECAPGCDGAGAEIRTRTPFRAADFKFAVSADSTTPAPRDRVPEPHRPQRQARVSSPDRPRDIGPTMCRPPPGGLHDDERRRSMATKEQPTCEVCEGPIEPGEAVVLGQESDGVTLPGILDAGADGRLAMFHAEHWEMRVGDWQERDRGHATER